MNWVRALGTAVGITAGGAVLEKVAERRDRLRYPPPGALHLVGPHRLHAVVLGSGPFTVLLEAGPAAWSTHWTPVANQLAKHCKVVTYDRAGLGWSEASPAPRTLANVASELDRLLDRLGSGPVISVGHSLGAEVVRAHAARYPDRVLATVLIDAVHPRFIGQITTTAGSDLLHGPAWMCHGVAALSRIGLVRLWSQTGQSLPGDLPPRSRESVRALSSQTRVRTTIARESEAQEDWPGESSKLEHAPDLPIRVISSRTLDPGGSAHSLYDQIWHEQSQALLEDKSDAQHFVVDDGFHAIPLHNPDAVVGPVLSLISQLGRGDRDGG